MLAVAELYGRVRRPLIALLAAVVLLGSPLNHVPKHSPLLRWPVFAQVRAFNQAFDLTQNWKMFAPPGRAAAALGAAFLMPDGWTDVVLLTELVNRREPGQLTARRGEARVHNVLRSHARMDRPGDGLGLSRQLFFENLGLFYCMGIGQIDGLVSVRFYLVRRGLQPFYAKDEDGDPFPTADQLHERVALYELDCAAYR
jgi:hypothetical protein